MTKKETNLIVDRESREIETTDGKKLTVTLSKQKTKEPNKPKKKTPYVKKGYKTKPNGKKATGRPDRWDDENVLKEDIDRYFKSISITKPLWEYKDMLKDEPTDYEVVKTFYKYSDTDSEGEDILDEVAKDKSKRKRIWYKQVKIPVLNNLGEQVTVTEWYEEPMISGLAEFLDVDPETLLNYGKNEKFFGTVRAGKRRITKECEKRLINRGNSGDVFNMKNHGWKDKIEVDNTNKNFDAGALNEDQRKKLADRMVIDD